MVVNVELSSMRPFISQSPDGASNLQRDSPTPSPRSKHSQQRTTLRRNDLPRTRQSPDATARTYGAGAGAAGAVLAVSLCAFVFAFCSVFLLFMGSFGRTGSRFLPNADGS
jgi:hypothetical protein